MIPAPLTNTVLSRLRNQSEEPSKKSITEIGRSMGLMEAKASSAHSDTFGSRIPIKEADVVRTDIKHSMNEWEVDKEICGHDLVKI